MPSPAEKPDLLTRIRESRIVQVLIVYLGASWVVLQLTDVLQEALFLPEWVLTVAVILLAIGMVITGATAWVQSMASTTAAEEAGEVPTDWQVAPRDAVADIVHGRLPHLTWGRAIVGGVVALSLLFGAGGLYVVVTGGEGIPGVGPAPVGADLAAEGIAVLPFSVTGMDEDIWREGMMDLLTNNLDGVGGYRTIDSRTVMARWTARVGADEDPDLRLALQAAGATGARYALMGSVVGLGSSVRLSANIYDLDTSEEVAQGTAEGGADAVLDLADDLALSTMRDLITQTGTSRADQVYIETASTKSLPALREFLIGESFYRKGEYGPAIQAYERAVAEDTTFAIAYIRLADAYGWLDAIDSEAVVRNTRRALELRDYFSPRYKFIVDAWVSYYQGEVGGVEVIREATRRYPDDPEAWFLLAEMYLHLGRKAYGTPDVLYEALDRAVELDPTFAPYLVHQADRWMFEGDTAKVRAVIRRYEGLTGNTHAMRIADRGIRLLYGTDQEAQAVIDELMSSDPFESDLTMGTYDRTVDAFDRLELVIDVQGFKSNRDIGVYKAFYQAAQGKLLVDATVLQRDMPDASRGSATAWTAVAFDVPLSAVAGEYGSPEVCGSGAETGLQCSGMMAMALAQEGRMEEADAALRDLEAHVAAHEPGGAFEDSVRLEADRRGPLPLVVAVRDWHATGDHDAARRALDPISRMDEWWGVAARLYLGLIEFDAGRYDEARRHAEISYVDWGRARAAILLAHLARERGDRAAQERYYRSYLRVTRAGDPDHRWAVEAREFLEASGQEMVTDR